MSPNSTAASRAGRDLRLNELPYLALLLEQIEQQLRRYSELGMLSVTLLDQRDRNAGDGWEHYQSILEEMSIFLTRFSRRGLRSTDSVLEPVIAGNSFVILLAPPRDDRSLDHTDLESVRNRLLRDVTTHLERTMPRAALERFAIYVGAAHLHHDAAVDCRRIIYRGLEEAIADAMTQREREGLHRVRHVQRILRCGQVRTVYQPVVDILDKRVIGYEALTRLLQNEFRTPDQLFKAAHESGALWPLERLCRSRALENLPSREPEQLLFLNIEPDSMHDPQLRAPDFLKQMELAGLGPTDVVLEVTEHAAVRDFAALRRVLEQLRALGFRLAMDDVGSGYAGLKSIAEMKPDYLKIDMSLVRDLHLHPIKRELIATIRRFSESTGIAIIAEGVESEAELESLSDVGVRCAQGFLFAEPDSPPRSPDWESLESSTSSDTMDR
jgi:EAL domain-containing protein (putative c-di-GMP-specific phosphodiesterase class I)